MIANPAGGGVEMFIQPLVFIYGFLFIS